MAINPSDLALSLQPLSAPETPQVQTKQVTVSFVNITNKIKSLTQVLQKHLGSPAVNHKIEFFPIAMKFKEVTDHLDKANQQHYPYQFHSGLPPEEHYDQTGYDFWKALQILKKQLIAFRKTATFKNSLGPKDKELLLVFQSQIEKVAQKVSRYGVLFLETEMEMLGRYLVNGSPLLCVVNEAIEELDLAKEYLIDERMWGYWKTTLIQINQQIAELQKQKQRYKSDFSTVHEKINSIILYIQARQALVNFNEFIENYIQYFLGKPIQPSPDMNALLAKLKENTLNILRQDNLPDYLNLLEKLRDGIYDYGKKIKISDFAILQSLVSTRSLIELIEFALDSSPFFKKLTDFANAVNEGIIPPGAAINIQKELICYQILIEGQENWLAWLNILKAIHFDLQNMKYKNDKGLSSLDETLQELITKISKLHIHKLPNTLESLPNEIIYSVFTSFLNRESRNALKCTSKYFKNFLNEDEKGQTKVIKEGLFTDEKTFKAKLPEISEIKKLAIEVFNPKIAEQIENLKCLDDLEIDLSKSPTPTMRGLPPKFKLTTSTLSRIALDRLELPHLDFVPPTVTELSLKTCTFSFDLSEALRQKVEGKVFDNLQRILLQSCSIQDDSIFEPLSQMPSLTSLKFINNSITDGRSAWLTRSRSLADLDLSYNFFLDYRNLGKIIPASTKTLTLKRLSPLELDKTPKNLKKYIPAAGNEAPKVTENFVEVIKDIQLTQLKLVNQQLPNIVLLTIMGMTSLQVLTHKVRTPHNFLGEGALHPPMLTPALCSEMKLTTLNFSGAFHQLYTRDKVPLMEALAYSKTLTDLDVSRNSLEKMPARFPPNLTRLDIYNNGICANPGPCFVLERLKSLNISGNKMLLYSWLDPFNGYSKYHYPGIAIELEDLNADGTDADIAWLTAIAYIPNLKKLRFRDNQCDPKDLKLFAGHPSLTEFYFPVENEAEARKILITLPELKIFNGHDLSKKGLATVLKGKEDGVKNLAPPVQMQ